jgi:hypothetical protein
VSEKQERICQVPGCVKPLATQNRSGVCRGCRVAGRLCRFCDAVLPARGAICASCRDYGLRTTELLRGTCRRLAGEKASGRHPRTHLRASLRVWRAAGAEVRGRGRR